MTRPAPHAVGCRVHNTGCDGDCDCDPTRPTPAETEEVVRKALEVDTETEETSD